MTPQKQWRQELDEKLLTTLVSARDHLVELIAYARDGVFTNGNETPEDREQLIAEQVSAYEEKLRPIEQRIGKKA